MLQVLGTTEYFTSSLSKEIVDMIMTTKKIVIRSGKLTRTKLSGKMYD